MQIPRFRFTVGRMLFAVAVVGITLAFLKSLVAFLDSPFLGPDPEGIAGKAPISFALRATFCASALWATLLLRKRLRGRWAARTPRHFEAPATRLFRVRFTVRRIMIAVAIIAIVLGALILFRRWELNPYVTARVFNETDRPLTDVLISYRGGVRKAERIEPGGMASWEIRSIGESGIDLTCRTSNGSEARKDGNVYIESGYRGYLEFHVGHDGIKVVDEIQAYPAPPLSAGWHGQSQ